MCCLSERQFPPIGPACFTGLGGPKGRRTYKNISRGLILKARKIQAMVHLYIPKVFPHSCSVPSTTGYRVVMAAWANQVKQMCSSFAWKFGPQSVTVSPLAPLAWLSLQSTGDWPFKSSFLRKGPHQSAAEPGQKQAFCFPGRPWCLYCAISHNC